MEDVEEYIREDIIRSVTTRMQIYYDALLANDDGGNDEEENQEINNTMPPRRVFFPIHSSNIMFSDYLFPNETEETTVKQANDILGISIKNSEIDVDAEVANQLKVSEKVDSSSGNADDLTANVQADAGKLIIILGIVGLIIALIVSVALHLFLKQ
jgi:hypothetical protein